MCGSILSFLGADIESVVDQPRPTIVYPHLLRPVCYLQEHIAIRWRPYPLMPVKWQRTFQP